MRDGDSVEEIYERLEASEVMFRVDRSVVPTMMKGATLSAGELAQLRRIDSVVRLGHVERINLDEIVLERGTIATSPEHLHVHCATPGLSDRLPVPIFTDDTITLQVLSRISLCMSSAFIGLVEGERPDDCREEPSVSSEPVAADPIRFSTGDPVGNQDRAGMARRRSPRVGRGIASEPRRWTRTSRRPERRPSSAEPVPRRVVPGVGQLRTAVRGSIRGRAARIFEPEESIPSS